MNKQNERLVVLGMITGVHGVGGMVKVKSFTQDPYAIGDYGPLLLGDAQSETDQSDTDQSGTAKSGTAKSGTGKRLTIAHMQPHKDVFLVRFEGVDGRDAAEALKGRELKIERTALPKAQEGEFYFADLAGLAVKRDDGQIVGKVVAVVNFGAGDLLEIAFDGHKKTELLAFDETTVPVVDVAGGFVVIDPPDWLFGDKADDLS